MLNAYLHQVATYEQKQGIDDRGQSVFKAPINVPCRMQPKVQNVLSPTGQNVQTQHIFYLTQHIAEGDRLNGRVVTAVSVWHGLAGEIEGYKAVT